MYVGCCPLQDSISGRAGHGCGSAGGLPGEWGSGDISSDRVRLEKRKVRREQATGWMSPLSLINYKRL